MTQKTPTFSIPEFELRGYTNPYLTATQRGEVAEVEERVNGQLDFLAQMLGWNGRNYWTNLPGTVSQKRQLLGGTFGVYNSYVIPKVLEIRNWDNKIVIEKPHFLLPGRPVQIARVVLGDNSYTVQSVEAEGDRYAVSIGELDEEFFALVAANETLKLDIPTYRPSPFYRPSVGISADYSFICRKSGATLTLHPYYDSQGRFPFKSLILFAGSVYYFDQPIYLSLSSTLSPDVTPTYDPVQNQWFIQVPASLSDNVGLTAYLAWSESNSIAQNNAAAEVLIQTWRDPSDWNTEKVLNNFAGVWSNKGGDLPFNFAFDSLSLHGFDDRGSVSLTPIERQLGFNELLQFVYSQRATVRPPVPPGESLGQLWWNDETGSLSMWLPSGDGGEWVEIDYRNSPRQVVAPQVVYADVTTFRAGSPSLPDGTIVRIDNISGLAVSDNVIGVQGTLSAPALLTLHKESGSNFWTPDEFRYPNTVDFEGDARLLPYKVPVILDNANGLSPQDLTYEVKNLSITISGDYEVILTKYYTNTTWEIYPDSALKFIAFSNLAGGPLQGQLWWDYGNADTETRNASIYYQTAWVDVNAQPVSAPPAPVLNSNSILFYADGTLLQPGSSLTTSDYIVTYSFDATSQSYDFSYAPRTFKGKTQLPSITISDSLTTTYRSDITNIVFGGLTYTASPNVYNSESPLRLWKTEALQVVDTLAHLAEDNYINPLRADLNNGPGDTNWQRYFVRLPLEYERNGPEWQKAALICQNFGYWGSSVEPEMMRCPPEDDLPAVYEELFLYGTPVEDYTYVYNEPYLYSGLAYSESQESGLYANAGLFPSNDNEFDDFTEAEISDYAPLHNRQAVVDATVINGEMAEVERLMDQAVNHDDAEQIQDLAFRLLTLQGRVYGDWVGVYVNVNPDIPLEGYFSPDAVEGGVSLVAPPVWDASIYKFAPTCETSERYYKADANNYKLGYAYFIADASAAEDAFFDIHQEAAWRYPANQPRTLYLTPR